MHRFVFPLAASALALSLAPAQAATAIAQPAISSSVIDFGGVEELWLAKQDKAQKKEKKAKGKPEKAKGKPEKAAKEKGKPEKVAARDKPEKAESNGQKQKARADNRRALSDDERNRRAERIIGIPAPSGRDMAAIGALILLGREATAASLPEDPGLRYLNCPPGLAKKDPPCVPPGLARKGVTYEEWASYDRARLDTLWTERREEVLRDGRTGDADLLLLSSERIAALYGLAPAPAGQRYALIDGMPVLLDEKDYT